MGLDGYEHDGHTMGHRSSYVPSAGDISNRSKTDALRIRSRSDSGSTASPRWPRSRAFPSMALRPSYATGTLKAGVRPEIISELIGPNTDASP